MSVKRIKGVNSMEKPMSIVGFKLMSLMFKFRDFFRPLAIQEVKKIAARNGIENLETIESACHTGLPENHVNVVLFSKVG
jgi:hypothetical protein